MPYVPAVTPAAPLRPGSFEPVATGGIASETELYTLYQRPIPEQFDLFARHMQYVGFATMLRAMGFTRMTSNPTTGHYEEDWIHELVTVGSVITPAASPGDPVVIELDAADMYDTGLGGVNRGSYPLKGDVIELPDRTQAQITAKNVAVNPHQITITPLQAAADLTAKVTAADQYGIIYNLFAEASSLPSGRVPRILKYTNTFAQIKHAFGTSGFELTNSVYHEVVPGQPGTAGQSIYVKIKRDDVIRFEHSKSGALVFGQTADNITDTTTALGFDVPISGTEGFVEFSRTAGNQDTYTAGAYTITDFDTVSAIMLDQRSASTNDIIGWIGPDLYVEIENSFTNTLTQNLIHTVDRIIDGYKGYANEQYHQNLTQEDSDAALSFGYSAIRKNGFIYHLKRMSEFNDIRRLGGSGYSYRGWAIWHPVSWTQDRLSGNSRSTIGYEYKGLGNYSRESVFGHLPGAGVGGDNTPYGRAINEFDTMKYFLMGQCAFHGAVGNGIVVQRPV